MTRLAVFALLLLAACDDRSAPADNQANLSMDLPQPVPDTPANEATPVDPGPNESVAADRADTIPVAFQGRWTGLAQDCGDPAADMELDMRPTQLLFHESEGKILAVEANDDGSVSVKAAFTGEGQSWTRQMLLTQSADGARLTIRGDGTSTTRKRC